MYCSSSSGNKVDLLSGTNMYTTLVVSDWCITNLAQGWWVSIQSIVGIFRGWWFPRKPMKILLPLHYSLTQLLSRSTNGQFQKISIPNHGRLPCFNPPLPSEIPKCATPPCPQNSIVVNPPSPSEFPVFFWKYIFDLATPIRTNEHEFMPPQGCDLAAPGDKLYSSVTRKTYASCQAVQTPF